MTTHSPIDAATYAELQEIMADEFGEIVEFFISDTESALEILQQCVDTQDSAQVGTICHKLKSSSKILGAFTLAELTRLLEEYKDHQDQPSASAHLIQLREEFAQVLDWLKQQAAIA
ncbi:Hpt domain-containing protein [Thiothrix winogradskyi]|uniref:Hpt domain-containing protein n=1 Tax=Thiothrix winogradskyi TaxID=96472 RepID=A0ABY3SY96_9GAMM|nr:Hpt domain-containing protein [Thiothrix winogradskyi]UJS23705.1 Hpt domain-containing protein [Thiothrix winogradskyi]